jgi:hypothetical protein
MPPTEERRLILLSTGVRCQGRVIVTQSADVSALLPKCRRDLVAPPIATEEWVDGFSTDLSAQSKCGNGVCGLVDLPTALLLNRCTG